MRLSSLTFVLLVGGGAEPEADHGTEGGGDPTPEAGPGPGQGRGGGGQDQGRGRGARNVTETGTAPGTRAKTSPDHAASQDPGSARLPGKDPHPSRDPGSARLPGKDPHPSRDQDHKTGRMADTRRNHDLNLDPESVQNPSRKIVQSRGINQEHPVNPGVDLGLKIDINF